MLFVNPIRLFAVVAMVLLMVLLGVWAYKMTQKVVLQPMQAISTNATSCIQNPSGCSIPSSLP